MGDPEASNAGDTGADVMSVADLHEFLDSRPAGIAAPTMPLTVPTPTNVREPMTPERRNITRRSYVRLFGHDEQGNRLGVKQEQKDEAAIVAMNNALLLKPEHVMNPMLLKAIAKRGFLTTAFRTGKTLPHLFRQGGYAFMVEMRDERGIATPYGCQVGFPHMPPAYRNLSVKSIKPALSTFTTHEKDTLQIWRSIILPSIDLVRTDYGKIVIEISPDLDGQELHNNAAGQATKLVDAVAAVNLEKEFVQCNVSEIIEPGSHSAVIASNEQSFGSNRHVFEIVEKVARDYVDRIRLPEDKKVVLAEVIFRILRNTPKKIIQILTEENSQVVDKDWRIDKLFDGGVQLANILNDGYWKRSWSRRKSA